MEKFMDKAEHFAARRFHVICVVALIITLIASIGGIVAQGEQSRSVTITDGSWHCPNCGTEMYLESKEG